jgi:O-antigen ligase
MYPALAPLRMERMVGMLTLVSLLLSQMYRHGRILIDGSQQTKHFLYLVVAAALSVPLAFWRAGAWGGVVDFIKLLIFYLLVVHLIDTRKKFRIFVFLYAAMILYIAVSTVVNYVHGSLLHTAGIDRAVGATSAGGGPNEMGATMATTIPLALLLAMHKPFAKWRWVSLVAFGFLIVTLAFTGSRSAVLGLLGGLGYIWWHMRYRLVTGALGVVLLLAGFAMLPEQYQGRYSSMTKSELDGSSQNRLDVWLKGLQMVAHRPLTGVGVHCFGTANAMMFSSGGHRSWLESHSLYVQVPAEMGLIGAFAFFSFLYVYVRFNRRTAKTLEADEGWGLEVVILNSIYAGTLSLLVTGVFGHSMMRPTWYLYAALGLCVWRIYLDERRKKSQPRPSRVRMIRPR